MVPPYVGSLQRNFTARTFDDTLPTLFVLGGIEPSSPAGPSFAEEDILLGNDGDVPVEDEGEGEELFGDNFERYIYIYIVLLGKGSFIQKTHSPGTIELCLIWIHMKVLTWMMRTTIPCHQVQELKQNESSGREIAKKVSPPVA